MTSTERNLTLPAAAAHAPIFAIVRDARDGRALDDTDDACHDVNALKPQVDALRETLANAGDHDVTKAKGVTASNASSSGSSDAASTSSGASSTHTSELEDRVLPTPEDAESAGLYDPRARLETAGAKALDVEEAVKHENRHATASETRNQEGTEHETSHSEPSSGTLAQSVPSSGAKLESDANTNANEEADSAAAAGKVFRDYANACDRVKRFYAEQHLKQTVEFNLRARQEFRQRVKTRMGVWEAIELLNTLIDDSDPDTSLSQIEHLLQTAEAIRRDGKPEWMQVTGLVHDLGKLLFFFGSEGQWDVVGDTFVVGAAFDEKNIYPETFRANPDFDHPVYSTRNGIYQPGCGMDNVMISWGHDEYMYIIAKEQSTLPAEGLAMLRYHSFYPWHRENAYHQFMNAEDEKSLAAVREFNPYDLYSKADEPVDVERVKPYYVGLLAKFFPEKVDW